MIKNTTRLACLLLGFICISPWAFAKESATCPSHFDVTLRKLHSKESINLCELYSPDKAILVVNTASHCGYTPQFKELEALHQKYKEKGLVVLGFPSDSFNQEEKTEAGTAGVCYKNYGVTFTMLEHVQVKGEKVHPLFQYLAKQSTAPSWNFNKYLVQGKDVKHFSSNVKPLASDLEKAIKL